MKTTFSIIKADVGGWPGHALVHPDLENIANKKLIEAKEELDHFIKLYQDEHFELLKAQDSKKV